MFALKGDISAATRGERALELAFLPLAGVVGQLQDTPSVAAFLIRHMRRGSLDQRIAATYGSIFFLDSHREVALLLTERVVLAKEDRLLLQATQEVLDLRVDTRDGGKCRKCGRYGGLRALPAPGDLEVRRIG